LCFLLQTEESSGTLHLSANRYKEERKGDREEREHAQHACKKYEMLVSDQQSVRCVNATRVVSCEL